LRPFRKRGRRNITPLFKAVMCGHHAVLESLLSHRADPSPPVSIHHYVGSHAGIITNIGNLQPVHIAAQAGDVYALRLLLEAKADPSPMLFRIESGGLSERRGDGKVPDRASLRVSETRYISGITPLHEAAKYGEVGALRVLLRHGANLHNSMRYRRHTMDRAWYAAEDEASYVPRDLSKAYRHEHAILLLGRHTVALQAFLCSQLCMCGRAEPLTSSHNGIKTDPLKLLHRLPVTVTVRICMEACGLSEEEEEYFDALSRDAPAGFFWTTSYLGMKGVSQSGNMASRQGRVSAQGSREHSHGFVDELQGSY